MSPVRRDEGDVVCVRNEDGVNITLKAGEDVGTKILNTGLVVEHKRDTNPRHTFTGQMKYL